MAGIDEANAITKHCNALQKFLNFQLSKDVLKQNALPKDVLLNNFLYKYTNTTKFFCREIHFAKKILIQNFLKILMEKTYRLDLY